MSLQSVFFQILCALTSTCVVDNVMRYAISVLVSALQTHHKGNGGIVASVLFDSCIPTNMFDLCIPTNMFYFCIPTDKLVLSGGAEDV